MATALAKFFKKKNNKENDEPRLQRGKYGSASLRYKSVESIAAGSKCAGVYDGGVKNNLVSEGLRHNQDNNIFNEAPTSVNQWNYKSPYWKVTEPKTRKSSRSVPGVSTFSTASTLAKHERFSPPLNSDVLYQHYNHSTIFEVSGSYENYPNNYSKAHMPALLQKTIGHPKKHCQKFGNSTNKCPSTFHSIDQLNDDSDISVLKNQKCYQLIKTHNSGHSNSIKQQRFNNYQFPQHNSTSEYGSADPSPNNQNSVGNSNKPVPADFFFVKESSLDITDYDSESDDTMPTNLVHLCEQQLRLVSVKCKAYKEKAKRYKANCNSLHIQLDEMKDQISNEKSINKLLNVELINAKKEVFRFREFISLQFRNNPYHSQYQHNPTCKPLTQLQEIYLQAQAHTAQINKKNIVTDNSMLLGAGEAMCSRTELTVPIDLSHSNLNSNHRVVFNEQKELDELKTFRKLDTDYEENKELSSFVFEEPRHSIYNYLSPLNKTINEVVDKDIITEDCLVNDLEENSFFNKNCKPLILKDDGGYSTMQQQDQKLNHCSLEQTLQNTESAVLRENDNNSSLNAFSEVFPDCNNKKIKNIEQASFKQRLPSNEKFLRRSFSDTELINMCFRNTNNKHEIIESNSCLYDGDIDYESSVEESKVDGKYGIVNEQCNLNFSVQKLNKKVAFDGINISKQNNLKIHSKKYQRHSVHNSRQTDYSSSYSSDDEAVRVLSKQLRHRRDLVQFRPPRKSLINCERTIFTQFRTRERQAIAQFDYLFDIPTDVSGFLSSPDALSR